MTITGLGIAIGALPFYYRKQWPVHFDLDVLGLTFKNSGIHLCSRPMSSCSSPWSNEYDPPLEDGTVPSPKLRKLEITANEAFDTYREMYYEGGVSSVFLWDLDDGGFAGVVLLKKSMCIHRGI